MYFPILTDAHYYWENAKGTNVYKNLPCRCKIKNMYTDYLVQRFASFRLKTPTAKLKGKVTAITGVCGEIETYFQLANQLIT